jgi:uncharacterized protein
MNESITAKIEDLVYSACLSDSNKFGYGIWTHHITQVVKNGKQLAKTFSADPEIVEIAAFLHDYSGIINHSLHKEHHTHSSFEAGRILQKFNYPGEKIEKVKHCIENHRGSINSENRSPEAECLASADAIAHIQNVTSLLFLVYVRFNMGIDEGAEWVQKKIERSWRKISPNVKDLVSKDYDAVIEFLKNSKRTRNL